RSFWVLFLSLSLHSSGENVCYRCGGPSSPEPQEKECDLELDQRHRQPEDAAVGRVLPQPLAARHGSAQYSWSELHWRLLVEYLRKERHRHLGDAGDRLPQARKRATPI